MRGAKIIISILLMAITTVSCMAQRMSYNHDETKMNQFTVQEIGVGELKPAAYYFLFHNKYRNQAASQNKLSYRSTASIFSYGQVDLSEAIDTSLTKRAEIEALNVADRSGGVADIAWVAEGTKVERSLERYQRNINRILTAGGTSDDKERWEEYYNIYQFAVKQTKDAYMPNSYRKQRYIQIYKEVTTQNELLLKYLVKLTSQRAITEQLSQHSGIKSTAKVQSKAQQSLATWRSSAWGKSEGNGLKAD